MRLEFESFWPLLLIALVPILWLVQRRSETDMSRKQLQLAGIVRSVIVVLLAVAIAQPVLHQNGTWLSVAYLVDVSQSVSPQSIQSAIQWITDANRNGSPDHAVFIPFSNNARAFDSIEGLKTVQVSRQATAEGIDQSATNIEAAVERASRAFLPNYMKRLVLFTDGNENDGRVLEVVETLRREGVRIYTVPMQARAQNDVWVENIMSPSHVTAEELFPLEVHVYSQTATSGDVEIKYGDKSLGKRTVNLTAGLNRLAFETQLKDTGPITIDAEVRASGDTFADNNRFHESVDVMGKPRVLYVEGRAESSQYLKRALEADGLTVDVAPAANVGRTVEDLDRYEAVIVSDVPRESFSDAQMKNIATYVGDLGGGFLLAGGDSVYGEGGYTDSVVEEVLPVKFELKKKKEEPNVSMIVVLDKSGSMGGQKIELAKEATKAAVGVLRDQDKFGVVAFDYNFYWPVRLQPVANRGQIVQSISTIIAGGETNIYPALREAYLQLFAVTAQVKHVILLSDGRSLPDDYQGLVAKMSEGKMTVSTVAVGSGADRELLANIAQWGKGRAYFIEDATRVPQIFTQETQLATKNTLNEEPFKPVVKKKVDAFKGIDFETAPDLLGYVSTQAKEKSEVLLESKDKDPILARWQYGLGKSVMFASDVKDRWAAEWLTWKSYTKFWSQLVRETMRRQDSGEFDFRVDREGQQARIRIDAITREGGFRNRLDPQMRVIGPDQKATVVAMHQVAPGSYQAIAAMPQKGTYIFRAAGEGSGGSSRVLTYSYPDEYHFYPPNTQLLRSLSDQTGGKFQPQASEVFDPGSETTSVPTSLWPVFAALALLLYLGDVLLRRVRLFDEA